MTDNEHCAMWVRIYNRLHEMGEGVIAERLIARRPDVLNYDEHGNYVGPVQKENGWTP